MMMTMMTMMTHTNNTGGNAPLPPSLDGARDGRCAFAEGSALASACYDTESDDEDVRAEGRALEDARLREEHVHGRGCM